ncbi:hypothetical protein D3C86_1882560 [compost metagenome]
MNKEPGISESKAVEEFFPDYLKVPFDIFFPKAENLPVHFQSTEILFLQDKYHH